MKTGRQGAVGAGEEAGLPAEEPAPTGAAPRAAPSGRRYTAAQKLALVREFEESGETFDEFCARRQVSSASLCKWRRQLRAGGEASLAAGPNPGNAAGRTGRVRTPEERRQALETLWKSGLAQSAFARVWGVSLKSLQGWLRRYRESGPKGLEPRPRGPRRSCAKGSKRLPEPVREAIAHTKRTHPDFGLKRVRDFLARFAGLRVSASSVARVLDERQVERAVPAAKKRRGRAVPRRFERARPNELWQSDITSFVIGRSRLRVYLIVFLDDRSRFVVSHGLYVYQRAEIARETLLIGVGRFGKPREVLTDQGRQYFAWRGKSDFQKLLAKQGIGHAVARAHHPETLGKCERLWETLKREFLERVELEDVADARERLGHFFAHYNFFRPHQGIEGLVPADRYFGAEEALRRTHEGRLGRDELHQALEPVSRRGAYLFGQIGDEQVSVFGERGQLVVHTSSGLRQEIGLDELGAPSAAQEGRGDGRGERDRSAGGTGTGAGAGAPAAGQEAPVLRHPGDDAAGGAGAVASLGTGGAAEGAPGMRGNPVAVAGPQAAGGGGEYALGAATAGVAAQPAGPVGDAGGPAQAAAVPAADGGDDDGQRGRPARAAETHRGAGAAAPRAGGPDQAPGGAAAPKECAVGRPAGGEKSHAEGESEPQGSAR